MTPPRGLVLRLAVRNALQRRGQTALIVLGCLLGTAVITGSLVVGDVLDASLRARAPEQLGPVDVVVRSFATSIAEGVDTIVVTDPPPSADGVLPARTAEATVTAGGAIVPRARVLEVDFAAASGFGGDPAVTGIHGATPAPGHVALGEDLARELGAGPGDAVALVAFGQERPLVVDRVLPRRGIAGYTGPLEGTPRTAFVTPGLLVELATVATERVPAPERMLLVSAEGDVTSGAARTDQLVSELRDRFTYLVGYEIDPVKQDLFADADEAGAELGELFASVATFAVLAGVVLLVNVLVLLAGERRRELGVLRAVGLGRRGLAGVLALEGACYAVVAAALGAIAGLGVGWGVATLARGLLASPGRGGVTLRFAAEPETVALGFAAGLTVALVTVCATSLRLSRLSVVDAVRDRPASRRAPRVARRAAADVAAAVLLVGALLAPLVVRPGEGDLAFFVVQGLVLSVTTVLLLAAHQGAIAGVVQRLGGARLVALRLALVHPVAHRLRTALVLLSYSLVVFTVVFTAVQSAVFATAEEQLALDEGAGFGVLATTNPAQPLDVGVLAAVDGVSAVSSHLWSVAEFRGGGRGDFQHWPLSGFDAAFLRHGAPALDAFDPAVGADAAAVWAAVAADPALAVADVAFLETGGGPPEGNVAVGDVLEVRDPDSGTVSRRTVAAISAAGAAGGGVLVSQDSFTQALHAEEGGLAGPAAPALPSRHLLALAPGADPAAVAAAVERDLLAGGVEARTFDAVVAEALAQQDQFFDLMEAYLVLGLLVGIAGVGVVTTRAVRERRREVGVLLALGCRPATVRRAFVLESTLLAAQGVLVGGGVALLTCWLLVTRTTAFGTGVAFAVPWAQLVGLVAVTVAASALAALAPAVRAARLLPSAALRAT